MKLTFPSAILSAAPMFAVSAFVIWLAPASAQPSRIAGKITPDQWTPLPQHVHAGARAEYDQGRAPGNLELQSVTLELRLSSGQQAALDQLLLDQQNPKSSDYHRWLTPEQYADRFGASQSDLVKIGDWARSQGLQVTGTARARNAVTLSGTAAQIGSAFHTEIHLYKVNGETHYANATDPSVPAAMSNLVGAIRGLHDFRMKPRIQKVVPLGGNGGLTPAYTNSKGNHYLAPDDFATIFDLNPLYNAGINGSGQKIVIVGQSQIDTTHLSTFTSYFGMKSVDVKTVLVPNKKSPGYSVRDAQESDLDLEWAAAVARGASLTFVYSYDVLDAVQYAIDQNLAPVISMSYGECETSDAKSDATNMQSWAKQAIAQGITWVAASGDSGAAGCYESSGGPFGPASDSLASAVDLPAAVPEVTAVGGTTFSEGSGTYWNSTNSASKGSARSYIPEVTWNDSASNGSPASSGGGASQFFSKPSWQTGTGVPNDGARDVPDVAFPASADHDGYMVYTSDGVIDQWFVIGGTSAGAPSFSGVLALMNQSLVSAGYQSSGGLGNINNSLYSLAISTPGAFHDITSGTNAVEACTDPLCFSKKTSGGYTAGTGYDQTTGLGSVDAYMFVTSWYTGKVSPAVSVVANPDTVTISGTTALTATVKNPNGGTPSGTVNFSAGSVTLGTATLSGSSGIATATLSVSGGASGLSSGSNTITAVYSGDSAINSATATAVLNVMGKPSISGLADAASYSQAYSPGMALSIFGSDLAQTAATASTVPLPTSLGNASVTINNVAAPFYYASPGQLNVQIPYETPTSGTAAVVVNANGQTASTTITMSPTAPGIYTDSNGYLTPTSTASAGRTVTMYVNGAGALSPAVATGSTPASGTTPVPKGEMLVTVGGVPAYTTYIGEPSWSVGVLQINFTVPSAAGTGSLPVVVSVGGRASKAAELIVSK